MLLTGQITVANRTAAHVIVSLWKGGLLTFGATERPLYLAPKKPGELFKRGFLEGGRGDKIKILGGKYCIRVEPYSEEHLDDIKAVRSKVGLTLRHRPQDLQDSITSSALSSLYAASVEEILAAVQAAGLCTSKQSLGEQLWDSLQNGLSPLKAMPVAEQTRILTTWVYRLYSSGDTAAYLEMEGSEVWKALAKSEEFDSMAVIDFVSGVSALLGQVQQPASVLGVLLQVAGVPGQDLAAVEEAVFGVQLEEWKSNPQLCIAVEPGCKADGSEYAVVGGPNKALHLADWGMSVVLVGDVDPYNPL